MVDGLFLVKAGTFLAHEHENCFLCRVDVERFD